jgi:hypothetical protein
LLVASKLLLVHADGAAARPLSRHSEGWREKGRRVAAGSALEGPAFPFYSDVDGSRALTNDILR